MSERYEEETVEFLAFDFEALDDIDEDVSDEDHCQEDSSDDDLRDDSADDVYEDDDFDDEPERSGPDREPSSRQLHVLTNEMAERCEKAIGYKFRDRRKLEHSLTHTSIARTRLDSNERLEFLGDAIMGAVICEHLYHTYPEIPEGEMTRIKSAVVSRQTCTKLSEGLKLNYVILLGKGLASRDRVPASIMAAVFEALVAGIFLDGGFEAAQAFVLRSMLPEVERVAGSVHAQNYKSMLQQVAQKMFGQTPQYRTMDEKGPDHSKCFQIAASIGSRVFPASWGPNKKEAEQNAARRALEDILQEDRGLLD